MIVPDLNDYEKEVVRFLAKHYDEKGDLVSYSEFPNFEELGEKGVSRETDRLMRYGLLSSFSSDGPRIEPTVLEVVHDLDHPPPKDLWKDRIAWFRSKWWSIPFLVLAIGLPLIVQGVEMIKIVLRWVGILE